MSNTPKIRFSGFTEDWEQRKLGDWGNFYYGRSCPKWSVTEDATIPCIRYGELYTKFGAKIDRVYSYTNMPPENLRFSKGTEVLIPRVGEDPMDYNHCTWLSMQDVAIGEMISVFNTDNNPLFTATMFNATLQNEFAMRVEGGSVTNLYFEKLKNIDVSFPSIPEQEKIAAYFENFDHLITLHQRKCDEVKTLKKYMLQKMFPQNEQKIPEIRFEGFTEAWEQRKLGDSCKLNGRIGFRGYTEKDIISKEAGGVLTFSPTNIVDNKLTIECKNTYITREKYDESPEIKISNGDILFVKTGSTLGKSALVTGLKEDASINPQIVVMRVEKDTENFMSNVLITDRVMKQVAAVKIGGAVPTMTETELKNFTYFAPAEKEEKKKIGDYFRTLDHLITLHQQKCEELKKIKKFMLQKMFV